MRWGLVCIALVGCDDVDMRSTVRGTFVDRLYTSRGVVEQPTDPSTRAYRVYSNGRWYPENGFSSAAYDGTIYIEAPEGPYVLATVYLDGSVSWYQREDHNFVDVTVRTGRPDAQPATAVPMQLQVSNLAPWVEGSNELFVDCYENGTEHRPFEINSLLSDGAMQLSGTFDWASTSSPTDWLNLYRTRYLIDATAGDTLTISRKSTVSNANLIVSRLTQIARGPVTTQRDGEASSFTGTFSDVSPTINQRFTVDMPAIAAQLPDVDGWVVGLRKSPSSVAFDRFGPSLLDVTVGAVVTAPVTFTESFGDPFADAEWQTIASGTYGVHVDPPVLPDGRRVYVGWSAYATEQRHLQPGADFTLGPTRTFVTSASIGGHALAGDVPWDGRSPLSFHVEVPAGETGFSADVLWVPAGEIYPQRWTTLRSQTADLVLPADALQLGLDYFVRVAVTNETETSHSAAYKILGPFRLVRQ